MKTFLKTELLGNLGRDSEYKKFDNGNTYLSFSVAHNESYTDGKGNKIEKTIWVACLYKMPKENLSLEKGCVVLVKGNLSTKLYTDEQKIQRISHNLNVNELQIIGKLEQRKEAQGKEVEGKKLTSFDGLTVDQETGEVF